jgi:hypothetical protein
LRRRQRRRGKIARATALCYQGAYLDKFIKMPLKDYDTQAEKALIEACDMGGRLQISDVRPTEATAENTIRAGLIRELLLGTEDRKPPARGLDIQGAWIIEPLDLEGEELQVPLGLESCTLAEDVNLFDCTLPGLYLTDTQLPALLAQHLRCRGSLHLRHGFEASGLVDLNGANITGQLDCSGGKFLAEGMAFNCNAMSTKSSVLLRNGFEAHGIVDLNGAKIGGQLNCLGGKFWAEPVALQCYASTVGVDVLLVDGFEARGAVDLGRAEITRDLKMPGAKLGKGLFAFGMRVRGGFIWQHVQGDGITVELLDAQVGTLHDQPGSWHAVKELHLSSFRYDRIESDMDVQERLSWLAKHDATVSRFTPAPYVQLANVLRRQGFAGEAAQVLIRREDKQRAAEWNAAVIDIAGILRRGLTGCARVFRPFLSLPFKWMFGYGHQPARVLPWIAIIWLVTFWFAEQTHRRGQFAPTSAVVLNSPEWLRSFPSTPLPANSPLWRAQLDAWVKTEPGRDYESFSAGLYALDLFIPLDALGQEKNWAPSASRGTWGKWGHWLRWLVQMAGWVITAVGAAVVTGLIGRRD